MKPEIKRDLALRAKKIFMGALMAASGAALIAAFQFLQGQDFGAYTPFVVAVAGAAINALRVFLVAPPASGHEN